MVDLTASSHLRCYRLPRTCDEAEAYVQQRRATMQLLLAFEHYYPAQFRAEWKTNPASLFPQEGEVYSQAELTCLHLMDEHELFPFALDYMLMNAEEDGRRMETIPLYYHGVDIWDRPLSDYDPGWVVVIVLCGDYEVLGHLESVEDAGGVEMVEILDTAKRHTLSGRLEHFTALCNKAGAPLDALPLAYRMVHHITNNAFLDPTDEMPIEDLFWDLEDIALLVRDWEEAKRMETRVDALANWIVADPAHLRKAVALWNQV